MTNSENESEKQRGLSKEAWTTISAVVIALIGAIVTVATTLLNKQPPPNSSPSTTPSGSVASPSPSFLPSPPSRSPTTSSPTVPDSARIVPPSPPTSVLGLVQDLDAVNIDFSDSKERDRLGNPFSKYPQFAESCLKLLSNRRLKKKVHFDVIFWNYEELGGKVTADSLDGDLNTDILKAAMVSAYNTRNGSNALSFGDIVELK